MSFLFGLLYIICIYIRPGEWIKPFYGQQIIDVIAILTAIFVVGETLSKKRNIILIFPQNLLLLGLLVSVALSHISHLWFGGAFYSFIDFSKIVIMFFLLVNAFNSEKKLKIALWLIVILTVIIAIQGIQQKANGIGWAGQPLVGKEGRITWIGIFNDPNDLALGLVMGIGILVVFITTRNTPPVRVGMKHGRNTKYCGRGSALRKPEKKDTAAVRPQSFIFSKSFVWTKLVSLSFLGVLLYATYLTNSRGGYLALSATLFYFFLRKLRKKWLSIILGSVVCLAIFAYGPSRLSNISVSEASAYGRIQSWYEGIQMIKSNPVFGVGYNMFTADYPLTAHNSYILVAAELGFVGLFFWVGLIYLCFKGIHILAKEDVGLKSYLLGLEISLVGFLTSSYFLSRSYKTILYVLVALITSCIYIYKKENFRVESKDIRNIVLCSLGIILVSWFTMRFSLRIGG